MREGVAAMIEDMKETNAVRSTSRRTFLLGAGAAAAAGGAMMVIGGAPALAGASTRRLAPVHAQEAAAFPPTGLKGDLAVAAVAASLENLAVFAYNAGLTAATAGKLGAVPPAVATFATTVKGQHQQHADAWNGVLKSNGKAAVTVTNPKLDPDGAVGLRQGDRRHGSGPTCHHPRDDRGADVSGRDLDAQVQVRHRAVLLDPAGRDAAHRHLVLRARHVPRYPDVERHAAGLQPDLHGGLSTRCGAHAMEQAVLVIAGVLLFGAYASAPASKGAAAGQSSGSSATGTHITISNYMYSPMQLTVSPGSTISVTNNGLGHPYADGDRVGSSIPGTSLRTRPRRSKLPCKQGHTTTVATSTST